MDVFWLYIKLFVTFFEIGLFGFGGGYGMLSLIQTKVVPDWITTGQFTDIVAISQMTPGPIGINSATYCGYLACHNAGLGTSMSILGSCVATFALVLPSLILMIIIAKMFIKYMQTSTVQSVFNGLAQPSLVCWLQPPCCCATKRTSLRPARICGSSASAWVFSSPPSSAPSSLK